MKLKITAAFLVLCALLGCNTCGITGVPEELLGVWGTSEPRYERCTFEVKKGVIVFENGWEYTSVNRIRRIERAPEMGRTLYHIHYEDEKKLDYTLSLFYYQTKTGDAIYFLNQRQVRWTKISPPAREGEGG